MTATPTLAQAFLLQGHTQGALKAAELATQATVELLRFRREGPEGVFPFGDPEPVAKLAEALLRTARIEQDLFPAGEPGEDADGNREYRSALGQLAAACAHFLEDQCRIVVPDDLPSFTPRKD